VKRVLALIGIIVLLIETGYSASDDSQIKFLWRPAYRPTYIYYENTDANTIDVLLSNTDDKPISKQTDFEPYRLEMEWRKLASQNMEWVVTPVWRSLYSSV